MSAVRGSPRDRLGSRDTLQAGIWAKAAETGEGDAPMTAEGYPETPLPGRRLYCPFCGAKLYDGAEPHPWSGLDARPPEGCEHTVFVYAWGDGIDEDSFILVRADYADALLSALESSEEYRQNAEAYARDPDDAREPLDAATREAFALGRFKGWDAVALRVSGFLGTSPHKRFPEALPQDTLVFHDGGYYGGVFIAVAPGP